MVFAKASITITVAYS